MRAGVTMTTTLLAKDTSHRTVFPVFTAGGGLNVPEMQGAGDFVMVADPATFRVLPWAHNTGWVLCDIVFHQRQAGAVLDAAALSRCAGQARPGRLRLLRRARGRIPSVQDREPEACAGRVATWPPEPPEVAHTTQGFQYLTESALRPGRADHGRPAQDHAGARHAAAFARGRARSEPVRVHLRAGAGPCRRRHHGAVPLGDEAGGAAARSSGQLHVPAEIAQRVLQRLASASVAARSQDRKPTRSSRTTSRSCFRRSAAHFSPG